MFRKYVRTKRDTLIDRSSFTENGSEISMFAFPDLTEMYDSNAKLRFWFELYTGDRTDQVVERDKTFIYTNTANLNLTTGIITYGIDQYLGEPLKINGTYNIQIEHAGGDGGGGGLVFPLTVAQGGTEQTSLTVNGVLVGDGVNPVDSSKQAPSGDFVGTTDIQTLTNKTLTDPSNTINATSVSFGGNVVDGQGVAPTTGQVVVATSATTMEFQNVGDQLTGGAGIDITTNTVSADLLPDGGLVDNAGQTQVDLGATSFANAPDGIVYSDPSGFLFGVRAVQANVDPSPTDDSTAGFSIGSQWINTVTETEFIALNVSVGAAVWKETTSLGAIYTGGAGVDVTGTVISADLLPNGGLVDNAGQTQVDLGATNIQNVGDGVLQGDGSIIRYLKYNLNATLDPTPANDSTQGYLSGSLWHNTTNNLVWVNYGEGGVGLAFWTPVGYKHFFTQGIKLLSGTANAGIWVVDLRLDGGLVLDGTGNSLQVDLGATDMQNVGDGFITGDGTQLGAIKYTHNAAVNPNVFNDTSQGYVVGSRWINVINDTEWVCVNPLLGGAQWKETTKQGDVYTGGNGIDVTGTTISTDLRVSGGIVHTAGELRVDLGATDMVNVGDGFITGDGTQLGAIKYNYNATVDPTSGDNDTLGYSVGSRWINTALDKEWVCVDATTAVWKETSTLQLQPSNGIDITGGFVSTDNLPDGGIVYNGGQNQVDLGATNIANVGDGYITGDGSTLDAIKYNHTANVPPTVNDDSSQGYTIGSTWIDITNVKSYLCIDNLLGGAVWIETSSQGTTYTGGDGVDITGTVISTDLKANGGLVIESAQVALDLGANSITNVPQGVFLGSGSQINNILYNLAASVDPTPSDDNTVGYSVGSVWHNTTGDRVFVCIGAFTGIADWRRTSNVQTRQDTVDPTASNDNTQGYEIGSLWFNTSTDKAFVALDVTTASAVWVEITTQDTTYTGGAGVDVTGTVVSADLLPNGGLVDTAGQTQVDLGATSIANVGDGYITGDGTQLGAIKYNHSATVPPTATDDSGAGYSVGSTWIDVSADKAYLAVDVTPTSAVWIETTVQNPSALTGGAGIDITGTVVSADLLPNGGLVDNAGQTQVDLGATSFANAPDGIVYSDPGGFLFGIKAVQATVNPSSNNDSTEGYSIGSQWINTTSGREFRAMDVTPTSAIWKEIVTVDPIASTLTNYDNFNAIYAPTVRWIPGDISGTAGALSWPSNVGSGSINIQGANANFGVGLIGGKNALDLSPANAGDTTKYVVLDLGTSFTATSFTLAFVASGVSSLGSESRWLSILDSSPAVGNAFDNTSNIVLAQRTGISGLIKTFFNSVSTNYTSSPNYSSLTTPMVWIFRYDSLTTTLEVFIQKATDELVHTQSVNLDTLDIRNLGLIYSNTVNGTIQISEVIFWDFYLNNTAVADFSQDLLVEYGVRAAAPVSGYDYAGYLNVGGSTTWRAGLRSNYSATSAPNASNDSSENYEVGSMWYDITNDKAYVCLDPAAASAVWIETTQTGGGSGLVAGDGIDIVGDTLSTDLKANGGLVIETGELAVDLGATNITGTLAVADGGTGQTTLTANGVLVGDGTNAVTTVKQAPTGDFVGTSDIQTLTNKTFGDDLAMGSNKITGLADPTNPTDGANKQYVDSVVTGLDLKHSVRVATTVDLDSNGSISGVANYNNVGGASGRGQITATLAVSGTFTVDGVNLANDDRVLVKNQTNEQANGIWTVTIAGTSLTLDRADDFDEDAEVSAGAFTFVSEGTTNTNTGWVCCSTDPVTIGGASGSNICWTLFSVSGGLIAGAGIAKTGDRLTTDLVTNSGLEYDAVGDAGKLRVNLSATNISGVPQGVLYGNGTQVQRIFYNLTATADPTPSNDLTQSYGVGSVWHNTTDDRSFVCLDPTIGNAQWYQTSNKKFNITNSDPTSGNDSSEGYQVGSIWINNSNANLNLVYILADATVGLAKWLRVSPRNISDNIVDPTPSNDITQGLETGSIWVSNEFPIAPRIYICASAVATAAVWVQVSPPRENTTGADPTPSDDNTLGYQVGSIWTNNTVPAFPKIYRATSVATGAAVWQQISKARVTTTAGNPTVNDDQTLGYEIGSLWFNSTNNDCHIAKTVGTGTAVWRKIA